MKPPYLIKPMLAKDYNPEKKLFPDKPASNPLVYPIYVQPKLDGFRCTAYKLGGKVECWSRPSKVLPWGKRFQTTRHIEKELEPLILDGDVMDGELYKHGWGYYKIVKHAKDIKNNFGEVEYHVYDTIQHGSTPERVQFVEDRLFLNDLKFVKPVKTVVAENLNEMEAFTSVFLQLGYEGSILRTEMGLYEAGKRTHKLLKYKPYLDEEFEIIAGLEGKGKEKGLVVWECKTKEGVVFTCRPKGSYPKRREYYQTRLDYVGKFLTVQFLGYGSQGAPREPVGLHIKEDI